MMFLHDEPVIVMRRARRAQRQRLIDTLTSWASALVWVGVFLLLLNIWWRL
jgi:hypothetical protein